MEHVEVLAECESSRLVLVLDTDAQEPYNDGGSPILRLRADRTWGGWRAEQVTGITSYVVHPRIVEALERFGDDERFARYVRAFHGATVVESWDSQDCRYVTLDPSEWREQVGASEGSVDLTEWRAYCEGDVYGWAVEQKVTWKADQRDFFPMERVTWEQVESCWGYYGREYAEAAARSESGYVGDDDA